MDESTLDLRPAGTVGRPHHATATGRRARPVAVTVTILVAVTLGVSAAVTAAGGPHRPRPSRSATAHPALGSHTPGPMPAPSPSPAAPTTPACQVVAGWDCHWTPRLAAVTARVAASPGQLALVLHDRVTGATFTTGPASTPTWAGSTIKLALAAHALTEARAGRQPLRAQDQADLAVMLHDSDDDAATRLWDRYGGAALIPVFREYGMAGLAMTGANGDWGALTCTTNDLAALMSYILDRLDAADRDLLVAAMRDVGDIQHWGTWAAGPAASPGTKNSWLANPYDGATHWNTSTVGFAGPDARYIVAVMYQMPAGGDSLDLGAHTVSDLVATLFDQPTPAPVTVRPS